ncbi:ATP-binding cassette domain-containing protein [Streptomyces seoulensis]
MIQAFGLTSDSRKDLPSAVDDVSFEVHPGRVTALLGAAGAGKTTTLRLMLELQRGRGITYFRGRPLHRVARPSHEVGALLGDVPGHPSRTVRGHLRMLCAAAGLPARRADEVLEAVGLVSLREERLGTLSRGMDRRLGLACALLSEPHALVLDNPADGLSAREGRWLHGMLRAHAGQGGTVLFTTADPKEAARAADRVLTLDRGVLVADQDAADFARHRLRPRVAVRSPHAARLADLLTKEARTGRRSVEVVREDGNRLSVYGSTCADIGEAAFRHGVLIHQLADEVGDMGPGTGTAAGAAASRVGRPAHAAVAPSDRPDAVEEEQASGDAPSVGRGESAVARRAADSHVPERTPPPGRALLERGEAVIGDDFSEPAATAAPAASPAEDTASSGRPSSAARTAPARTVSARTLSAAQRPDSASATARADTATTGIGRHDGPPRHDGRPRNDGGPSEAADDGSGTAPARVRAEPRALVIAPENPPPAALAHPDVHPDIHSAAPRPDGSSASRGPGHAFKADRPDAERLSGLLPDEPLRAHASDSLRPAPEQPPAAEHVDSRHAHSRHGDPRHGGSRSAAARPATGQPAPPPATGAGVHASIPTPRPAEGVRFDASSPLPPPISVRLGPGPLRPLRYELRRASGIGTGFVTGAVVLVVSALTALIMGGVGHSPQPRLLAAWPQQLPLPPAALGAGLLGALAFGDEFRHPALAVDRGTVPRRLGLLAAKLLVAAATGLMLAFLTIGCDAEVLYLVYGRELTQVPGDWLPLGAGWFGLVVGCAWTGLLAAGLFRSTTAGLAAVVAAPVVVAPLVQLTMGGAVWDADGLPARLRRAFLLEWPFGGDRYLAAAARMITQPLAGSVALSLVALGCGYAVTVLRSRGR